MTNMPKVRHEKVYNLSLMTDVTDVPDYSDDEEDEGCEEEADDDDGSSAAGSGSGRVVQTVPAKEPRMDAVPLKSALKKPGGPVVITRQQNGRKASSPAQEKNQNSRYNI